MHGNRLILYTILIAALLSVSTSHASWEPDKTDTGSKAASPFSLDSTGVSSPQKTTAIPSPVKQEPSSPFTLPPKKTIVSPALSSEKQKSVFTLPPERKVPNNNETSSSSTIITVTEDTQFDLDSLTATELQELGLELARENNFENARVALAYSLEKEPDNLLTLNLLGLVMHALGRLDDALQAYIFALKLDDGYALSYKNIGSLLEEQGDDKLAIDAYRKYCLLAPDAADLLEITSRADLLEAVR